MEQYAKQYPNIKFAITDDPVSDIGGLPNEEGITYATQEGGCLVGVLAAKMAKKMGHKVIGVAGGIEIPPVDSYIAGYKYCAAKAVPGTKTLVQYSGNFTDESACATIAQNEINQGAQVIFQVAGLCGDGALKEASKLRQVGHRRRCGRVQRRQAGSSRARSRRPDVGVYDTITGGEGRPLQGWQGPPLQPQEQRRRRRQDQPEGPEVGWIKTDEHVQDEDHQGQAQASGGVQGREVLNLK